MNTRIAVPMASAISFWTKSGTTCAFLLGCSGPRSGRLRRADQASTDAAT